MTIRKRRAASALAIALAIAGSSAGAQAPGADAEGPRPNPDDARPRRLESIEVIKTQPADDRRESTTARIVVPHEDLVRYGDTALSDVLKRLPGITIEALAGGGAAIRMRGLGTGYTQILLDGEPAPPGFSLDSLSPGLVERIEILRVPTADLSARSIAGTINIVLRKRATRQRTLKASAAEAREEPTYGLEGQLADRMAGGSYSVAVSALHRLHDGPGIAEQHGTDPSGQTNLLWSTRQQEDRRNDNVGLTPRVTWNVTDRDTLATDGLFRYLANRTHFAEATTTLAGAPPAYAANDLDYGAHTFIGRGHAEHRHRFAAGASLDAKLGVTYQHFDSDASFHGFDAAGTFVLDRNVRGHAADKGLFTSGKYRTPIVDGHALAFGWDGEYAQRDESRLEHDATPAGDLILEIDERYRSRLWRMAGYAQDEWDISQRWSAYAGVRFEALDTRTTGNTIAEAGNRSSVLSPILQALWRSQERRGDQVRMALSRTYKAPTTRQLTPRRYVANNNTPTTPDYQGNPDLRPERAWGIDVAYEHYFGADALVSVSAFARRVDDVILDRETNVEGTWITFPANTGSARVRGIELETKFNLRDLREHAPNVLFRMNLGRNWSRVDAIPGPDNRLDRQVPVSGTIGVDCFSDGAPLTIGGSFTFKGGGPVRTGEGQSEVLPIRRALDAYALWIVDTRTQLRLSFQNILRQDYAYVTSYFDEAGRTDLATTTPTGTLIRLAVEWSL
ncbi:MAG: TonB-dependent receptor plug domain-containing protein [Rudaea sp.]